MASGHDGLTDDLLSQILVFAVDGTTTGKTGPFPVSKSTYRILGKDDFTVEMLVKRHGGKTALMKLAARGRKDAVKLLLTRPNDAPRADCQNGDALVWAAQNGHSDVVRLLLTWKEHAPRADCRDGDALVWAAAKGRSDVVRLLLSWPANAPRADCRDGEALVWAAWNGHSDVVKLLLTWSKHAPRADCWGGDALVQAADGGHLDVVRLLLGWKEHAPRADCRDSEALVRAADGGHLDVVRLLLERKEHGEATRMSRGFCSTGGRKSRGQTAGMAWHLRVFQKYSSSPRFHQTPAPGRPCPGPTTTMRSHWSACIKCISRAARIGGPSLPRKAIHLTATASCPFGERCEGASSETQQGVSPRVRRWSLQSP